MVPPHGRALVRCASACADGHKSVKMLMIGQGGTFDYDVLPPPDIEVETHKGKSRRIQYLYDNLYPFLKNPLTSEEKVSGLATQSTTRILEIGKVPLPPSQDPITN
ncbi:hypothetical protein PV326_000697 [Microctonus aethiopoides]|nr:hypothetical protein PV326_000697 [Microctonus aethiopoides]